MNPPGLLLRQPVRPAGDDRADAAERRLAAACLLAAIATGIWLRFWRLDWDGGFLLHPDEYNLIAAAARWRFAWGTDPGFHAYGGLALSLPIFVSYALSLLSGGDPFALQQLSHAARIVSAAQSSLALACLPLLASRAWPGRAGRWPAVVVAWLAALDVGLVQAAHFGTTESGLVLVVVLLALLAVLLHRDRIGPWSFAAASGALIGLGFGLKATAAAFMIIPAVAGLLALGRLGLLRLGAVALLGAVAGLAALGIVSPHTFRFGAAFLSTMRFEADVAAGRADVFWTLQFRSKPPAVFAIAQLPWLHGPLVPGVGLAGLLALVVRACQRHETALALLPLAVFTLAFDAFVLTLGAPFVRYWLPGAAGLLIGVAWIVTDLARSRTRASGRIAGAMAGLVLMLSVAWCYAFTAIYRAEDVRLQASRWLAAHLADGDRVLIEPHDVGLPLRVAPLPAAKIEVLPLLEPENAAGLNEYGRLLSGADRLIVASRRHSSVLPRLPGRFGIACAYYSALQSGELGLVEEVRFDNGPRLGDWRVPRGISEETFEVFDHPVVIVFRRARPVTRQAVVDVLARHRTGCRYRAGVLGRR